MLLPQRRAGRVAALELLYQADTGGRFAELERIIELHFVHLAPETDCEVRAHAEELCLGVRGRLGEIDRLIQGASRSWRIERMSRVDRCLLRLAVYEMTATPPLAAGVAINEAIEIAREFGGVESPAFINGVLGAVARQLGVGN